MFCQDKKKSKDKKKAKKSKKEKKAKKNKKGNKGGNKRESNQDAKEVDEVLEDLKQQEVDKKLVSKAKSVRALCRTQKLCRIWFCCFPILKSCKPES